MKTTIRPRETVARELIRLGGTDNPRGTRAAKHDLESAQVELQGLMEHEERLFRVLYRGEEKAGRYACHHVGTMEAGLQRVLRIAFKADEDIRKYVERSRRVRLRYSAAEEEAERSCGVQNRAAELEEQLRKSQTRDVKEQVEHQSAYLLTCSASKEIAARRRQSTGRTAVRL